MLAGARHGGQLEFTFRRLPNLRIGLLFLVIAPAYLGTIEVGCDPPSLIAHREMLIARQMSAIAAALAFARAVRP